MKGYFVSLEGIDGCGKSTHAKALARWLRSKGFSTVCTDEPTSGPIGKIIKKILGGKLSVSIEVEVYLFAADRAWHLANRIMPALEAGKVVINERYVASSLAYQTARGASPKLIKKANGLARKPDLSIFIDVPPKTAATRVRRERNPDEFEKDLKLQREVQKNYIKQVRRGELIRVDGSRWKEDVQKEIRELMEKILK